MSGFLDWKYVSEESIGVLEAHTDENEIKRYIKEIHFYICNLCLTVAACIVHYRLLHEIFLVANYKESKQSILVEYHFHNYA